MDDYTFQQELEALAGNAFGPDDSKSEPISVTIKRWQQLFSLSQDAAVDRIVEHRNDLTRPRVSDEHWEMLREEKEASGYDREAYEYELETRMKQALLPNTVPAGESAADSTITYLVELTGSLSIVEDVQHAAGLQTAPPVVNGQSTEDGRAVSLCCIDSAAKAAILKWASEQGAAYEPTILVDPRSLR